MDKQISFVNCDIKDLLDVGYEGKYDVVTCNPPYFKYKEGSLINQNENKMIARHEVCTNLEEVIKTNGTMALVHRPERLMDILFLMRKYNIEPKKMRFVYSKEKRDANMVLVEGSKNGKAGLKMLAPLIVYDNNGEYTEEVRKMFGSD